MLKNQLLVRKTLKITFPNESNPIEIGIDLKVLKFDKQIAEVIFCWFGGIYVNFEETELTPDELAFLIK